MPDEKVIPLTPDNAQSIIDGGPLPLEKDGMIVIENPDAPVNENMDIAPLPVNIHIYPENNENLDESIMPAPTTGEIYPPQKGE